MFVKLKAELHNYIIKFFVALPCERNAELVNVHCISKENSAIFSNLFLETTCLYLYPEFYVFITTLNTLYFW